MASKHNKKVSCEALLIKLFLKVLKTKDMLKRGEIKNV